MTMPIFCPHCLTLVGVFDTSVFAGAGLNDFSLAEKVISNLQSDISDCSRHQCSKKTETRKLFSLINQVYVFYPETETSSSWEEYVGPPNKFLLWFAIFCGTDGGIRINDKWAWWEMKLGFFGDGVEEFEKLKLKIV